MSKLDTNTKISAYEVDDGSSTYWEIYNTKNDYVMEIDPNEMGDWIKGFRFANYDVIVKTQSMYLADMADEEAASFSQMPKRRCIGCDWIVDVDNHLNAVPHGWADFVQCSGTGKPTEHPNVKNF